MADMVLAEGIAPASGPKPGQRHFYAIADTRIINRAKFVQYGTVVHGAVKKYQGRYLALTERVGPLEGGWEPQLLMLPEFASEAAARAAYAEVRDGEARKLGVNSAMIDLVLVHGLAAEREENGTFL